MAGAYQWFQTWCENVAKPFMSNDKAVLLLLTAALSGWGLYGYGYIAKEEPAPAPVAESVEALPVIETPEPVLQCPQPICPQPVCPKCECNQIGRAVKELQDLHN